MTTANMNGSTMSLNSNDDDRAPWPHLNLDHSRLRQVSRIIFWDGWDSKLYPVLPDPDTVSQGN